MKNPMVRIARLDHDLVYWGLGEEMPCGDAKAGDLVFGDPVAIPALPEGAVYVDRGCDLPHGMQRWNATARRFEPLPREQRKAAPEAPTLEQALYDYLATLPAAALPTRTAAWCAWFRRTVDERDRQKGVR